MIEPEQSPACRLQTYDQDMGMRLCSILAPMAVLLMAGCSEPTSVALFNNIPDTIYLITTSKRFIVPASSQVRFEPGIDESTAFLIETREQRFAYKFNGIPIPNHFLPKGRRSADLYFQLQGDAKLYLVKPDATFPVENLHQQPQGFPLVPVRTVEME